MTTKDYLFDSDRNIAMFGRAGTGKTTRIQKFVKEMEERGKKVLVCAPTGTAAVNACGETAHSLFGIPIPCYGVSISKTPTNKIKVLAGADIVIIDEISMMRNDAFSYAMRVLKKAEKLKGGRIRVILVGDFSQLPPVVPKKEEKFLKKFGYALSGYAFTAKEWAALNLRVVELTKIYRQDEAEFIENLGKVRDCDTSCVEYFNRFVDDTYSIDDPNAKPEEKESKEFNFDETDDDIGKNSFEDDDISAGYFSENFDDDKPINPKLLSADCVVLCGTNAEAERINKAYRDSLPSQLVAYEARKKGRNSLSDIEDIILLKEEAKVMFTVNDDWKNRFQNGTMGKVTICHSDHVTVRLESNKLVNVYPHKYTSYSYKISGGELTKSKVGEVLQIPLKIAAAITIHKSQGKTFEKAIINPSVFTAGQLYVALSRVTSPSGLILTASITEDAFVENTIISEFYKNDFTYEILKKVKKSKTVLSTEELDSKSAVEKTKKTKTTKVKPKNSSAKSKSKVTKTSAKKSKVTSKSTSKTPARGSKAKVTAGKPAVKKASSSKTKTKPTSKAKSKAKEKASTSE